MGKTTSLPRPQLNALPQGAHFISAFSDEALFQACGVRIVFTGREGGVSQGVFSSLNTASYVGDEHERVEENIRRVQSVAQAEDFPLITCRQVHQTRLLQIVKEADVSGFSTYELPEADGIVVACPQVSALLNSADCLLLIAVAPSGRFALAHAGWRGALAHIAHQTIQALQVLDESSPGDFNVYLGPCICPRCFEVEEELPARFKAEFGDEALRDERHLNLAGAVSVDLARAGVDRRRIAQLDRCTKCEPQTFFSYRAEEGKCGRQAAFACKIE